MSVLDRAVCLVRGHRWEQTTDAAGTITSCSRCAKLRHEPGTRDLNREKIYEGVAGGEGPPGGGD